MSQTITTKKTKIKRSETMTRGARRLFNALAEFMDSLENILEERGDYREDFLRDLRRSIHESKTGKAVRINSLRDLR